MDTMKAPKLKPMKSQSLCNHILVHSMIALACSISLLCFFPSQSDFIKHFLFTTLPCSWYSFVNPKCLFIVVNVIVGLLIVGESKSSLSLSSSSSSDSRGRDWIYEEYVKRKMELNLIIQKGVVVVDKPQVEERNANVNAEDVEGEEIFEDVKEEEEEEEVVVDDDRDEGQGRGRVDDGEDQHGMPTEELNRRVEAFIAKVNKQRWLEAKSLVCCKA